MATIASHRWIPARYPPVPHSADDFLERSYSSAFKYAFRGPPSNRYSKGALPNQKRLDKQGPRIEDRTMCVHALNVWFESQAYAHPHAIRRCKADTFQNHATHVAPALTFSGREPNQKWARDLRFRFYAVKSTRSGGEGGSPLQLFCGLQPDNVIVPRCHDPSRARWHVLAR